jgi:hypothetical protein
VRARARLTCGTRLLSSSERNSSVRFRFRSAITCASNSLTRASVASSNAGVYSLPLPAPAWV